MEWNSILINAYIDNCIILYLIIVLNVYILAFLKILGVYFDVEFKFNHRIAKFRKKDPSMLFIKT